MNKKAVTLFEIIVSTVVFVLVIAGLTNVFISSRRYNMHSHSRVIVSELGKFFLDSLQKDVRQDAVSGGVPNCLHGNVACPIAQTINGIIYTPDYAAAFSDIPVGPIPVNLRKAKLKITWDETNPT